METYTVDYSIPQEDEMEQVLSSIIFHLLMNKLFPRCRLMRTMTPPSSSLVLEEELIIMDSLTVMATDCRMILLLAMTVMTKRRRRMTQWRSK